MPVFRVEKVKDYSIISNYIFRDKRLSWKAKGILAEMLSLPDEWDFSVEGLSALGSDGLSATRSAIKELEKYGYLARTVIRQAGKIIDWEYSVYEKPLAEKPLVDFLQVEKPQVENLQVEKPLVENRTQLNTNQSITNQSITKEENTKKIGASRFAKPSVDEIRDYCNERKNSVDPERFFDYYESNGWMVGTHKMKNWQAAVRTWENRDKETRQQQRQQTPSIYGYSADNDGYTAEGVDTL